MAPPDDAALRFVLKIALHNALKLVRGLRKQISDIEEDVLVAKLIEELRMSSYKIVKKPGTTGHAFSRRRKGNALAGRCCGNWQGVKSNGG
jgi:hypothetical protein